MAAHQDLFLAQLGRRVRDARGRLTLSRKALAESSGVSERFLAQLEVGCGNISVLRLRQVAQALQQKMPDLLREGPERPLERALLDQYLDGLSAKRLAQAHSILLSAFGELDSARRRHRIALIGLRGAGKTALGRLLAARLKCPFIELDQEIEREAGAPLAEIFSLYGQAAYKRLEGRCLEKVIEHYARAVIAVGGGVVMAPATFDVLRAACFTVWLQAAPEDHMARVIAQGDLRPMAGHAEAMADLRQLLAEREDFYRLADVTIQTSGRSVEQSLAELTRTLRTRDRGQLREESA